MSSTSHKTQSELDDSFEIDRLCRQYERAVLEGDQTTLKEFLNQAPSELRSGLFCELVRVEWESIRDRGESPDLNAYRREYVEFAHLLDHEFAEQLDDSCSSHENQRWTGLDAQALPESIGEFKILRKIGQGGMGVVFEAYQTSLDRPIALKLMTRSQLWNAKLLERFRREVQVHARLRHPYIAPVFGVGESDGFHYFAMELIDGVSLDACTGTSTQPTKDARNPGSVKTDGVTSGTEPQPEACTDEVANNADVEADRGRTAESVDIESFIKRESHDRFRHVARIGQHVGEALEYAHERGVLHRDVKPANLMLDRNGHVWLTDFGLAGLMEGTDLTETGEMPGTLRYMPPESLGGEFDQRGDVYGLGLTLYELLAGQPAFASSSRPALIEGILHDSPTRLRRLAPDVPRDLETIVTTAIAREADRRYQTAGELAADLERFLKNEPIRARRTGLIGRARLWARRSPVVASLSSLLALVVVAALAIITSLWLRAEEATGTAQKRAERLSAANTEVRFARDAAEEAKFAADRRRIEVQINAIEKLDESSRERLARGEFGEALIATTNAIRLLERVSAEKAHSISPQDVTADKMLEHQLRTRWSALARTLPEPIADIAVGRWAKGLMPSAPFGGGLLFSGDGSVVTLVSDFGRLVRFWDLATGTETSHAGKKPKSGRLFTPDSKAAILQHGNGKRQFENLETGAIIDLESEGKFDPKQRIERLWRSDSLVTALFFDGTVSAWDPSTGRQVGAYAPRQKVTQPRDTPVAMSGNGRRLAIQSDDQIVVFDLPKLIIRARIAGDLEGGVISRTGRYLLVLEDSEVVRYELPVIDESEASSESGDGVVGRRSLGHLPSSHANACVLVNAGGLCVVRCRGDLWKYRISDTRVTQQVYRQNSTRATLAVPAPYPNSSQILTTHEDGMVTCRDVRSGRELCPNIRLDGWALAVGWSPDGQRIGMLTSNGRIRVWQLPQSRFDRAIQFDSERSALDLSYSPDGNRMVVGTASTLECYKIPSTFPDDDPVHEWRTRMVNVVGLAWSGDGSTIFARQIDGKSQQIVVLNANGKRLGVYDCRKPRAVRGERFLRANHDGSLVCWGDRSGTYILNKVGHERWSHDPKAGTLQAVEFTGLQARAVGAGFRKACDKSGFTIWACSILPEHVHCVIARHTYKVEYIAGLLKGEATKELIRQGLHPLAGHPDKDGKLPTPWAARAWRVYLDSEEAIENAIHYTEDNPEKEGKPRQKWKFVTPFAGLDKGWVTYH